MKKAMEEIRVSTWNELNEQLYAGAWQGSIGRFRSRRTRFRGMCAANRDLTSSLIRLGLSYEKQEGHMLRNFRKYARSSRQEGDTVWNWLAPRAVSPACLPGCWTGRTPPLSPCTLPPTTWPCAAKTA